MGLLIYLWVNAINSVVRGGVNTLGKFDLNIH